MTDLVVTTYTPTLGVGRHMRTYGMVRALASLGPVDVLYLRHGRDEPAPEYLAIENARFHAVENSKGPRRALAYATARARGVPAGFARGLVPELAATAERLANEPGRGRVIADGPVAATGLMRLARRRPVIYSAFDVESSFRREVEPDFGTSQRMLERFERALLERVSESWMISLLDVEAAERLAPRATVRYLPAALDVAKIEPVAPGGERRVLYVANFNWPPNVSGLRFLLDEVAPLVWERVPDARFAIAGAGLDSPPSADPRVETLGFVDDLRAAYASADCVAVPLLEGGGVPIKFLEALAYGLPVVATPKAAAPVEARAGEHFLQGDGADEFAAALVRTLEEGAPEVAARARSLAEDCYSIEATARRIAP